MMKYRSLKALLVAGLSIAVFFVFSGQALAYTPNDLSVFTGFRGLGSTTSTPVDVGGSAEVVPVPGLIPLQAAPYYGNHFDNDHNNSPDANSVMWGTSGNFYNLASWYKPPFIWCGAAGGWPYGLTIKVSALFQHGTWLNGANKLTVGGVVKNGYWVGEWWRQANDGSGWVGHKTAFSGPSTQILALNPGLMVVIFTFIETPPPPTYAGTIQIEKHLVPGDNYPSPGSPPYNAKVGITNNINSWNPQSTSNPYSHPGIWVDPQDPYSNSQRAGTTGSYNTWVDVPAGYEVDTYTVAGSPSPQDHRTMICTGANNTGRCKVNAIRVSNNATTTVKFNLRQASKGLVVCRKGVDSSGTANGRFYWEGYGIDASNQANAPVVKLYQGSTLLQTIAGNRQLPNNTTYTSNNTTYPGMLATTNYDFMVDLDSVFHDGRTRSITPKLVTAVGTDLTLPNVSIGGSTDVCGGGTPTFAWAWPWLRTSRGDVIASGQINGQVTSPDGTTYLGARPATATNKEAEFLIISAVGNGGPFCSTYNYILTNITATTAEGCGNGAGYSILNSYPLNSGGNDVIVEGVKKAYDTFSKADPICSADKTTAELATITVLPGCGDGVVYKLTGGNTLSNSINVTKGRVTIYVEGDLYINANIIYSPAGITNIKDYPNLAIVVRGNVNIASSVANISALIYASGKIDTCATASAPSPTQNCFTRLSVDGSLIAKSGIRFGRSYYDSNMLGERLSAEYIALTPQTFVYPAPGIDRQSAFSQQEGSYTLDPGEYNPRF